MQNKFILTDGQKAVNLLQSDDPSVWTYFSGAPRSDNDVLYAQVAAAFRAYNLKANTVGNMPFTLNDLKTGEVYDESSSWENKVGFLPNPSELLRLDTLSYMATNTIYNLRTSDVLGYKTKGLYHAVAYTFYPWINPATTQLDYIERWIGAQREIYQPDDKRLVRMWRLDHTTEVLPSPNTEARAIMNAAGEVYYADAWIKHFYERGGVAPTVIAMKGAVAPAKKEEEEKSWKNWILGLGARFRWNPTRVVNADVLEVKQFGSSVTDLKNMEVYQQAIANIAMGTGMPLSLLLANSANYATAQIEKATWYDSDIIPFCNWLAYGYNEQVFMPLGYYLEFHPETLDPEQEDETQRAQAFSIYGDAFGKYPTYDLWKGMADTLGLEISDSLDKAAQSYYADRKQRAAAVAAQTQQSNQPKEGNQQPAANAEGLQSPPSMPPAKFMPTLDQLEQLKVWRSKVFRHFKRGEAIVFEWTNELLPESLRQSIVAKLAFAKTAQDIEAAFDVSQFDAITRASAQADDIAIKELAAAINRLADARI